MSETADQEARVWHRVLHALLAPLLALAAACGAGPPCPLCDAIETGEVDVVRDRLSAGDAVTVDALRLALDPPTVRGRLGMAEPGAAERTIAELVLQHGDVNAQWSTVLASRDSRQSSRVRTYAAAGVLELWGDRAIVALLLARGLDVRGVPGGEALVVAARHGHDEALEALLDAGAPVQHVAEGFSRTTALAEAIQRRDRSMIARLETTGALEWQLP